MFSFGAPAASYRPKTLSRSEEARKFADAEMLHILIDEVVLGERQNQL
jgi:hypothetical protein